MNEQLTASEILWNVEDGNAPVPPVETLTAVDLGELLLTILTFIRRFVVLTDHQAIAVALWVAHTHAFAASDATPYLQVTSATPRAGKTRLLEVLEQVVARPWLTGRTSAAALTRKVDEIKPTLLLDESDAAFSGPAEYTEALRGVLNSGYRNSGRVTLCVGQGMKVATKDFETFCCKAIAGIGKLPDTVADRSIPVALKRRARNEPVERWRERQGKQQTSPIRTALVAWSASVLPALRDARPDLPIELGDRAADVWEPLLAIADMAGGDWPRKVRRAAIDLMGREPDDDLITVQLLADLRDIFGDSAAMSSADLLRHLAERDDRPWATWSKGKPITGHALSRLLKPFGVVPAGMMRIGGELVRGYRRGPFEDAWKRYLPETVDADVNAGDDAPPGKLFPTEPDPFEFDPTKAFGDPDDTREDGDADDGLF
jgi:hypothetical protein